MGQIIRAMAQDEEEQQSGGCVAGFVGLCYWAMLAASTIGPGTITLMSKGGAEFGLRLIWTIPIASLIAYCLQEGGARLQILQQTSFGGAMRIHFQPESDQQVPVAANIDAELARLPEVSAEDGEGGPVVGMASPATAAVLSGDSLPTPKISIAMATMVVVANTFLEIAQFAGLMAAVKYYAGDPVAVRLAVSIMLAITVALILFKGNVDKISQGLGLVVVVMTVTFTISASQTGFELGELVTGFLPQMPDKSASGSPSAPQAPNDCNHCASIQRILGLDPGRGQNNERDTHWCRILYCGHRGAFFARRDCRHRRRPFRRI